MSRPDLDAIRARADEATPYHGYEAAGTGFHNDYCRDVPALLAYNEELERALGGLAAAAEKLANEAMGSVEYSDWPELQKAVRRVSRALGVADSLLPHDSEVKP